MAGTPEAPPEGYRPLVTPPCPNGSTGFEHQGQRAAARGTLRWQLAQINLERKDTKPTPRARQWGGA